VTLVSDQPEISAEARAQKRRKLDRGIRQALGETLRSDDGPPDDTDSSLTEFISGSGEDEEPAKLYDIGTHSDGGEDEDEEWENVLYDSGASVPVTPGPSRHVLHDATGDLVLTLNKDNIPQSSDL